MHVEMGTMAHLQGLIVKGKRADSVASYAVFVHFVGVLIYKASPPVIVFHVVLCGHTVKVR